MKNFADSRTFHIVMRRMRNQVTCRDIEQTRNYPVSLSMASMARVMISFPFLRALLANYGANEGVSTISQIFCANQ